MPDFDTRPDHGYACYCQSCQQTAGDWFAWATQDGRPVSQYRYWTLQAALAGQHKSGHVLRYHVGPQIYLVNLPVQEGV